MSVHPRKLRNGRTAYDVKLRDPAGRQYSRTFRTRKEAENYAVEQRSGRLHGSWVDPRAGKLPLGSYAALWLAQRVGLRPRTVELYRYLLGHHIVPHLGDTDIAAVSPAQVRAWQAKLMTHPTIGPSTVAKAYRLLKTIMATAVEDELIPRNPCTIKGAAVERPDERPIATVEQVAALAAAVPARYRSMILVATWCGLRIGELAALSRADVDLPGRVVRVRRQLQELADGRQVFGPPKTAAGHRSVAIPPHVLVDLRHHMDTYVGPGPDAMVFTGADGDLLRRSNFTRRVWHPACRAVGVAGLRFHDLRHTGNTLAASTGASTRELMARMGHTTPRAALIYPHATAERDHALAEALSALAGRSRTAPDGAGCSINVRYSALPAPLRAVGRDKSPGQRGGDDGTRTHDPLLAKQVL